jgi:hypothetical protein
MTIEVFAKAYQAQTQTNHSKPQTCLLLTSAEAKNARKFKPSTFSQQETGSQESILELDLDRDIERADNTSDESRRRNSVSPMPQIRCTTEHHQVIETNLVKPKSKVFTIRVASTFRYPIVPQFWIRTIRSVRSRVPTRKRPAWTSLATRTTAKTTSVSVVWRPH